MPTTFPTALDSFTNPTAADNLNSATVPHADQHANVNDAIEALEAKVGVDGSGVTVSFDYRIAQLESSSHAAVTIGTANGLSLAGQVISLAVATAGNAGALSAADWTTFNNKQSALTFPLAASLGGTGIANGASATLTLPNAATTITGGGTLALGGFTLTVPATGTAALLATANVFTAAQTVQGNFATPLTLDRTANSDAGFKVKNSIYTFSFTQRSSAFTRPGVAQFNLESAQDMEILNSNAAVVAYFATGTRRMSIGNTSATVPVTLFPVTNTTTTNAVAENTRLQAVVSTASTGGAAGFGVGLSFYAETSTDGTNQQQGAIDTAWVDATNASRKARMLMYAYDTAAREGIRIEASGTAAMIGFLGAAAVARPTAYTQTYSTTTRTFSAYTSDPESAAYTGIDNAQAGTVYATVADLNQLRTAYETLRAHAEEIGKLMNQVIDDMQAYGLLA